jgi:hypothetical protein
MVGRILLEKDGEKPTGSRQEWANPQVAKRDLVPLVEQEDGGFVF